VAADSSSSARLLACSSAHLHVRRNPVGRILVDELTKPRKLPRLIYITAVPLAVAQHGLGPGNDAPHAHELQAQFCADQGQRLCTYQELCPTGCGDTTYQDAGHSWVPYSGWYGDVVNDGNSWVFVGDDGSPPCRDHNSRRAHTECGMENPAWGGGDIYGSGVYCC